MQHLMNLSLNLILLMRRIVVGSSFDGLRPRKKWNLVIMTATRRELLSNREEVIKFLNEWLNFRWHALSSRCERMQTLWLMERLDAHALSNCATPKEPLELARSDRATRRAIILDAMERDAVSPVRETHAALSPVYPHWIEFFQTVAP
jgi:hypothetical protein